MTARVAGAAWQSSFANKVYAIVRRIPRGRVMTYGAVAACIPTPRGVDALAYARIRARWVGYAMASAPQDVPWQRVVNAGGRPSPRPGFAVERQQAELQREGVRFGRDGRIDLDRYAWTPRRA